jgi:hypothetical protein
MSSETDSIAPTRNMAAQSAFASTLVNDSEKGGPSKAGIRPEKEHKNMFGVKIKTPETNAGSDAVFWYGEISVVAPSNDWRWMVP